jgi:DNA-directed RNA polymerase III subunit RPC7
MQLLIAFQRHPDIKKPAPLTDKEQQQIKYYKNLQEQIHRGPLYTQPTKRHPDSQTKTFSEEQFNAQYGTNSKADMDPFTGVETYSMRFQPKNNTLPKLSDRPFSMLCLLLTLDIQLLIMHRQRAIP